MVEIIRKNSEYKKIYRYGKSYICPYFVLYVLKNKTNNIRVGFTATKKIGNAVKRNRAKRRLKSIFYNNSNKFSLGKDIIVVARKKCIDGTFNIMEKEFYKMLERIEK